MSFWESFYVAALIASAISSTVLLVWFFYDVFWRQAAPRTGGRYEPDREQLRKLQAKRRDALRRLGSNWVLHQNQPPVKWGYKHD